MTDDSIGDELHRLREEFRKLAGLPTSTNIPEKTSPEQLAKFGLTLDEARAWLEQEPDFNPSDGSYHNNKSDKKLPEPEPMLEFWCGFGELWRLVSEVPTPSLIYRLNLQRTFWQMLNW